MAVPRTKQRGGAEKIWQFHLKLIIKTFKTIKKGTLPLEEGMCGAKHSIDDVEVSNSEAGHHLS